MVRHFGKKLNRALLVLVVAVLCCISVAAAPSGSIRVMLRDSADQPVNDVDVRLIRVATITGNECALETKFKNCGIDAGKLLEDPSAGMANKVFQYAFANEIEGTSEKTSPQGCADFKGLREGVYLVFEPGDQEVAFAPFLVIIPTTIDGEAVYQLVSVPKISETNVRTLICRKLWEDNMNAAGGRPDSVAVTVLRDGVPYQTAVLSAVNGWKHKFSMLPESGTYTVSENPVPNYDVEYRITVDGYTVVNRYTGDYGGGEEEPAHVSVVKVWNDDNNGAGKRPESITVQLIENGTVVKTAILNEANQWKHTFVGLDGTKIYTAKEITVPDYSATYSGDAATGILITNTYSGTTDPGTPPGPVVPDPGNADIPFRVEWVDQNNAAGKRPGKVSVHLLADDNIVDTIDVSSECNWEGTFRNVDADLSYSVWQIAVEDYTTTYSGDAATLFVITNTYTEGTTDPGTPPDPTKPTDPEVDPDDPGGPAEPEGPTIPQTGEEVLPVYLLMGAGILMVVLGLVDLYRGRGRYERED